MLNAFKSGIKKIVYLICIKIKLMRNLNLLLFLTTSLFCTPLFAQNLSMAQLLELRKKTLGEAEEYLTSMGWEFAETQEPKPYNNELGYMTFTYDKDFMQKSAQSHISYLWSDCEGQSCKSIVDIQFDNNKKYNEYINSIKIYGCKLLKSSITEEGNFIKYYKGKTTTIIITTSKGRYQQPLWRIRLYSNIDYPDGV
jgi:hypothetical protein